MIASLELLPNNYTHGRVGSPGIPMATFAATPVHLLDGYRFSGDPEVTLSGIVCGQCSDRYRDENNKRIILRHASVEHVRACYDASARAEAEAAAEYEAERRNELYFEGAFRQPSGEDLYEEARERWLESLRGY